MANILSSSTILVLVAVLLTCSEWVKVEAQPPPGGFKCSSNGSTSCRSIIDYVSPNATTLGAIQNLFNIKNLRSILGANGLLPATPPSYPVAAKQTVRIRFKCVCNSERNGTGASDGRPKYKVKKGDTLYNIAAKVFSNLVTYPQIQAANKIPNAELIQVGQELWIPLPCSCDQLNGAPVVHYGHVVQPGSSVEQMAEQYGVTADTIMNLNGIVNASKLLAGQVLDIPLKACSSSVRNGSMDFPLLVSNGTYVYTANNCVKCTCDSANNWTLKCEPSQLKPSSNWTTCPAMQCEGSGPSGSNLLIGNTTSSDSCNQDTCSYAGYDSQRILTSLTTDSTCPASGASSITAFNLRHSGWTWLLFAIHIILFYAYLS